MLIGLAGRHELAPAIRVVFPAHLLERDAGQLAVLVGERLRDHVIEDRDALVHRVLLLPRGRFHLLEPGTDDDLYILATEPSGRTAAIHRGVAAAEHDHALADLVNVPEGDARKPIDA